MPAPFDLRLDSGVLALHSSVIENEFSLQGITQMIAQQSAPEKVLEALVKHIGQDEASRQAVFFLTDGETWTPAQRRGLTPQAEDDLARVNPADLSDTLFNPDAVSGHQPGCPFPAGWARHLYSGTGELLGMFVCLWDGPMLPFGLYAARIESACQLATLAIEQRNLIVELEFKADHDAFTSLFNRSYYERVLDGTLRRRIPGQRPAALIYLNLDRFRLVNDVMGYETGNQLLQQVGARFGATLTSEDVLARVGGDEFAVLRSQATVDEAGSIAEGLLDSLSTAFAIDGHELFISASIGIVCSTPQSTRQSLEREATIALYNAKQAGKGRSACFHSSMAATPPERLELERRLRRALERQEMRLYYQPQVNLSSGLIDGAEALLRWQAEGLGSVSPAVFVAILEETGLILEFGNWALGEACRQGKEWKEETGFSGRIGVNVSALQLARTDFVEDVQQALLRTGFPPKLLELELTESVLVSEFASVRRAFGDLQTAGVNFALDDFGTGQSSLAYLQQLPFQRLKIDQSFIRPIRDEDDCPPLVASIVRMAESLGLSTIAEGIETAHQADLLRTRGCTSGQGFLFGAALPPQKFMDLFKRDFQKSESIQ
jgi:diguanylate cyclase (GGDEF)-like protein